MNASDKRKIVFEMAPASNLIATKQVKAHRLALMYQERLERVLELFYSEITEDEKRNDALYIEYIDSWKKLAYKVNATQKGFVCDLTAFEKEIERLKEIALQNAITQQQNGEKQN